LDSGVKLSLRFDLVSGVGIVRGRGDLRSTTFLRSAIPCLCLLLAYSYNHLNARFLKPLRSRVVCHFLDSGGQRMVIWVGIRVGMDVGGMDLGFLVMAVKMGIEKERVSGDGISGVEEVKDGVVKDR
jgi:hypothetical protein